MSSDNKRIAKNTVFLYARMIVSMLIGMWTSRLVLNALGFTDQGIYNVVGGFVGFLSLVSGSIGSAISRFITIEIGKNNIECIKKVVGTSIAIQIVLAIIVLLLAESIGLWYVNNKLVVDHTRLSAVNMVYQFSVFSFIVNLFSVTPNALIIAYEKMSVFAFVSIFTSLCSLTVGIIITYSSWDRLVLYAALQFVVFCLVRTFYQVYCRKKFPHCFKRASFDKEMFKPMFSFAGWNMVGTSAFILRTSGTSVLLNFFGGPIANTINGIANQVNVLATMLVEGFTNAYSPQITKKYATGRYSELIDFICRCSKFSYCLILIIAVPLFIHVGPLLTLWLKKIPEGTEIFARLIIIYSALECVSKPLTTAKHATGDIRNYQLVVGGILLLTIPISYLFLKIGLPLWFSYIAFIISTAGAFVARLLMLRGTIPNWSTVKFIKNTLLRCLATTIIAALLPSLLNLFLNDDIMTVLFQFIVGLLWCCFCVYSFALSSAEKNFIVGVIKRYLVRFKFC